MRARTIGLLLAAGLCGGCSATSLKATPIWDEDFARAEGPSEDRLNLWPLLYYRDPALSVFWPLFSSTDTGQELVPLYAYERGTKALRVVSLFPWLPAAAQLEPDYTRVLGVISDREKHRFAVLPLYYGSQDGFWTPALTRFRKGERRVDGWLAPLALHIRDTDEESWDIAWPLISSWREDRLSGTRVAPLFWHERGPRSSYLNVGGFVFARSIEDAKRETFWLWPLGAVGRDATESWNRFVPLWYSSAKAGESLFLSLPYQQLREGDRTWQSAFGLVHRLRDREGSGHALLPLYWRYQGASTQTLLTLAGGYSKGPDHELLDVLGPVYWSRRKQDTRTTAALWPLLTHTSSPDARETRLLLGAAGAERATLGSRRALWAYPLFEYSMRENGTSSLWSPALAVQRWRQERTVAESRIRGWLEFESSRGIRDDFCRSDQLSSLRVDALLGMAGSEEKEMLAGRYDESGALALRTYGESESWLRPLWLLPVWQQSNSESGSSSELFWRLYDSHMQVQADGQTYTRQRILWRLLHRETLGARRSVDVFPFVAYDRDDDLLQWSFMGGLIGWRRTPEERVARLFWLPLRRSH